MQSLFIRLGELRNAVKLARRSVGRNLTQSLLIVLIMAIPVAAVSFSQIYQASRTATVDEALDITLGQTDALFMAQELPSPCLMQDPLRAITADGPFVQHAVNSEEDYLACIENQQGEEYVTPSELGLSGEWLIEQRSSAYVETSDRLIAVNIVIGESWNPALSGRYHSLTGSAPKNAAEVLVSRSGLEKLGLKVGDELRLSSVDRPLQIVGTLESNTDSQKSPLVFAGSQVGEIAPELTPELPYLAWYFLVSDEPVTWNQVVEFNTQGLAVLSRSVAMNPPTRDEIPMYSTMPWMSPDLAQEFFSAIVGGAALFVALLFPIGALSSSAFAFGARRQARNLAIVASLGASSRMLKAVTIASGVWLALLGGIVGLGAGLGLALWRLNTDFDGSLWSYPGFHFPAPQLAIVLGLSLLMGIIFSLLPAIRASKVDIQTQLRGTRIEGNPRPVGGVFSLLLMAVGGVIFATGTPLRALLYPQDERAGTPELIILYYVTGGVVMSLGFILGAVWILKLLFAIARRLSGPTLYAFRDLIFNHRRYVPVISSLIAVMFAGTSIIAFSYQMNSWSESGRQQSMPSNQVLVDVTYQVPNLTNPYWQVGVSTGPEIISEQIELATPLLVSKVDELRDLGAIDAALLEGQPRPLYFEGDGSAVESKRLFARISLDPSTLCPWDPRSPNFDEYSAAELAVDLEALEEIQALTPDCGQADPDFSLVLVGDSNALRNATAGLASDAAYQALEAGKVIVFSEKWLYDNKLTLDFTNPALPADEGVVESVSVPFVLDKIPGNRFSVFMAPETARALGVYFEPVSISAYFKDAVNEFDLERLRFVLGDMLEYDYSAYFWNAENTAWVLTIGLVLLGMMVALIAIGLSQLESRADRGALWSVGASRWYRSRVVGLQGFTLAAIGTVLGSGVALISIWFVIDLVRPMHMPTNFPIAQLVAITIGLPVLVGLIAAGFGSGKLTRKRSALD